MIKRKFIDEGKEVEVLDVEATFEELQSNIDHLEGEISSMMEILGSYVDGINLLNAKIFALELKLK